MGCDFGAMERNLSKYGCELTHETKTNYEILVFRTPRASASHASFRVLGNLV